MKKRDLVLMSGVLPFLLIGCVSRSQRVLDFSPRYPDARTIDENNYTESFNQIAISPSGDSLVIVGRKFDYVLSPPNELVAALKSPLRSKLTADFENFSVNSTGQIEGTWIVQFTHPSEDAVLVEQLMRLGFQRSERRWALVGKIYGARFVASSVTRASLAKTNQTYMVDVSKSDLSVPNSPHRESPVTTNEYGAVLLMGVLLSPLMVLTGGPCFVCK